MALDLDSSDGYDGLDVQFINANTSHNVNDTDALLRNQVEPVDGSLGRNEVAELVAVKASPWIFVGTSDNLSVGHGRYQLGTDPKPHFNQGHFGFGEPASSQVEVLDTDGPGTITETDLNGNIVEDVENEIWLQTQPHNNGSLSDDVNGLGAGGTMHMAHVDIHFREMFGKGPVLDRHHDIYEVMTLEKTGEAGGAVSIYRNVQLYWDVQERS